MRVCIKGTWRRLEKAYLRKWCVGWELRNGWGGVGAVSKVPPARTSLYVIAICMYYETPGLVFPCFPSTLSYSPFIFFYPPGSLYSPDSSCIPNLHFILILNLLTNKSDCIVSLWPPDGRKASANMVLIVTTRQWDPYSLILLRAWWLIHEELSMIMLSRIMGIAYPEDVLGWRFHNL